MLLLNGRGIALGSDPLETAKVGLHGTDETPVFGMLTRRS
jgi:hypothetical protein